MIAVVLVNGGAYFYTQMCVSLLQVLSNNRYSSANYLPANGIQSGKKSFTSFLWKNLRKNKMLTSNNFCVWTPFKFFIQISL